MKFLHADHEVALARAWLAAAARRVHAAADGIIAGGASNGDDAALAIARDTLKAGKYLAVHPLRLPDDVSAVV